MITYTDNAPSSGNKRKNARKQVWNRQVSENDDKAKGYNKPQASNALHKPEHQLKISGLLGAKGKDLKNKIK